MAGQPCNRPRCGARYAGCLGGGGGGGGHRRGGGGGRACAGERPAANA